MFTFIRVLTRPLRRQPAPSEPSQQCQDEDSPHNPWQGELERLALHQNDNPDPRKDRRFKQSYAADQPAGPRLKQGTLTDLKAWWGKAITSYTPPPSPLSSFAPPPVKKTNRWNQF